MKTTVEIPDPLLAEARAVAGREGRTLRALIEEGLRLALKARRRRDGYRLQDRSSGHGGFHPDVQGGTWESIRERVYEGRGG